MYIWHAKIVSFTFHFLGQKMCHAYKNMPVGVLGRTVQGIQKLVFQLLLKVMRDAWVSKLSC